MKTLLIIFALLAGGAGLVFCGGCKRNPYDSKISAKDQEDFNQWISITTRPLSVQETDEINACLKEIRISFMLSRAAKGQANINQMFCEKVNGLTLKDVLVTGYELQIQRLESEKARYLEDLNHKEKIKTRPGDLSSENFLNDQKEMVREHIGKLAEQINRCSVRLEELRKRFDMPEAAEGDVAPRRV